jgi:hypothetical protein
MLEQGMAAATLPLLDQSTPELSEGEESDVTEMTEPEKKFEFKDDPNVVFAEEKEGWKGYVALYCCTCISRWREGKATCLS